MSGLAQHYRLMRESFALAQQLGCLPIEAQGIILRQRKIAECAAIERRCEAKRLCAESSIAPRISTALDTNGPRDCENDSRFWWQERD